MRHTLAFAGLLSLACATDPSAPNALQGSWAADIGVPGAGLVINLDQAGGVVSGTGTYRIEAGRSGTLQVHGTYDPPSVALVIRRDVGSVSTYTGTVVDARHLSGTMVDALGHGAPLTFTRR